MTVSLNLTTEQERELAAVAARLNISVSELATAVIRDLLSNPTPDFDAAAQRVLDKNQDLYRRLAQVRYLSLGEIVALHQRVVAQTGGSSAIRDLAALESAVAQPRMTSGGVDLYPDLQSKAVALAYSLIQNHPFIDGNKRVGHAALETMLVLNQAELNATIDDAEAAILGVASGKLSREAFLAWVREHCGPLPDAAV